MKERFKDFTDEKIALLAQKGDRDAEHYLLEKYRNFVSSKSYPYFIVGGDSDDLLQEGMIGLYKGIHSFKETEKSSFRNFASLCIKRQIITAIRSANCQKNQLLNTSLSFSQKVSDESEMTFEEMLGVDNSLNPEDIILGKEQANFIEKTIKNELSSLEWIVFLGYMNGEKFSKMAKELEIPIKSVYNAIDRSRKKIMKSLKGEKMIKELEIIKIKGNSRETVMDKVAEEVPFHIYIEKNHYVTLMCSPENLVELGYGFLFFDGVIKNKDEVADIIDMGHTFFFQLKKPFIPKKEVSERAILSGCGKGSIHTSLIEDYLPEEKITRRIPIEPERISELMKDFKDDGEVFLETGGVHRVALGDASGIICGFDDIGRHNAVDKNIGYALTHNIFFEDKILFSTGRVSSDLLAKAIKARIPLVISHTAPTTLAVEMGRASGVQIIGFARGKRMNIYS